MAKESANSIALMSIHPEFAESLMTGTKKVEFRRVAPKEQLSHVVIYATRPVAAVIGGFEVAEVDRRSPAQLWKKYGAVGGIAKKDFFDYFDGVSLGAALVVKKAWRCAEPLELKSDGLPARPPQSFMYLKSAILKRMGAREASYA